MIMGGVVSLSVIQKSDGQRIDGDATDGWGWLPRSPGISGCPFCNAPGVVLVGFGRTEPTEVDSFSVDSDEGGASVVAHFWGRGL